MRDSRRLIGLAALATVILGLDQITKAWALAGLDPARPTVVLPGLVNLTLILNPGVAFGILAGVPEDWRWVVSLVSVGALVLMCILALRLVADGGWPASLALGLVFGGATGNLLDRWRHGAVVDFLDVHWRTYHWPAFNVADSAITVGVALLAAQLAFAGHRRPAGP